MKFVYIVISTFFSMLVYGQTTVIKAGKLIDVEKGIIRNNQLILIEGNTITSVGKNIAIPKGANFIDLSKATVMPGLIDCHTHLTDEYSGNYYESIFSVTVLDRALVAPIAAQKTLMAGFTTCRDVGSQWFLDVALKKAIKAGKVVGPRMQTAGLYIGSTGSHGDLVGFSPFLDWQFPKDMMGIADGVEGVKKQVRYNIKYGADVIKFGASAGVLSGEASVGAPQYSQEEMNAIVEEAKLHGVPVCAHAHGTEAIKMAVRAGVTSIEHGSFLDDEAIRLMKDRGTYLVADIYNDDYILSTYATMGYPEHIIEKERLVGRTQRESFQRAVKAGVKVAFGSDAGVYPHGDNGKQFFYMVKYGLSPVQAIQSATIWAATLLGWEKSVGSITKGKWADIVAVEGNIEQDISEMTKVSFVMKDGIVYKNEFVD